MTSKIPVRVVDQIGNPYEPTELEKDSIIEHIYCYEYIEPSWVRSIVVNTQESMSCSHPVIIQGFYLNNSNDPFILSFCSGAPPVVAMFSHSELKKRA